MRILGTGLVCAQGRGRDAVADEPNPPSFVDVPFQSEPFPVYAIAPEILKDKAVLGSMRRADRFSKMATMAAYDAMADSGIEIKHPERVGIIFATAFGPHNTTFRFQDDIIDYGDAGVSPTVFSNSVHNAAVSYISRALGIKGPTWTITGFRDPFGQAVDLAQAWLSEGRCDKVLLGAGDECGTVMEYICSQKLPIAADGKVRMDDPPAYVPGEGAAFFLVDGQEDGRQLEMVGAYDNNDIWRGSVPAAHGRRGRHPSTGKRCDIECMNFTGGRHASIYGNMLTGSAMDCAADNLGN